MAKSRRKAGRNMKRVLTETENTSSEFTSVTSNVSNWSGHSSNINPVRRPTLTRKILLEKSATPNADNIQNPVLEKRVQPQPSSARNQTRSSRAQSKAGATSTHIEVKSPSAGNQPLSPFSKSSPAQTLLRPTSSIRQLRSPPAGSVQPPVSIQPRSPPVSIQSRSPPAKSHEGSPPARRSASSQPRSPPNKPSSPITPLRPVRHPVSLSNSSQHNSGSPLQTSIGTSLQNAGKTSALQELLSGTPTRTLNVTRKMLSTKKVPSKRKSIEPPKRYSFVPSKKVNLTGIEQHIVHLQKNVHSLIPRVSFQRFVREITVDLTRDPTMRYSTQALECLQEAAESYIIGLMEDANLLAMHAKRITLYVKDLSLARKIRGDSL